MFDAYWDVLSLYVTKHYRSVSAINMSGRRGRPFRRNNVPDEELLVNKELADLGMLEEGMSLKEKQETLQVVRLSQTPVREKKENEEKSNENSICGNSEELIHDNEEMSFSKDHNSVDVAQVMLIDVGSNSSKTDSDMECVDQESQEAMNSIEHSPNPADESLAPISMEHLRHINIFESSKESGNCFNRKDRPVRDRFIFLLKKYCKDEKKFSKIFKKVIAYERKILLNSQKLYAKRVPWGKPIVGETITLLQPGKKSDVRVVEQSTSTRYNFRGRERKLCMDVGSESEEDKSDTYVTFAKRKKSKQSVIKQKSDKNTNKKDTVGDSIEVCEVNENGTLSQSQGTIEDMNDSDGEWISTKNLSGRGKLYPTASQIRKRPHAETVSEQPKKIVKGPSSTILRPAPRSIKMRRMQNYAKELSNEVVQVDEAKLEGMEEELSVVYESRQNVPSEKISCPICRQIFPATDIEEHASDCNLYKNDRGEEEDDDDDDDDDDDQDEASTTIGKQHHKN